MFYWLIDAAPAIPGLNVFRYITFRTGGAIFTALLYATTRRVGIEALAASTKATETLVGMERAYLTGGGDIENRVGQRCFRVDVAN